MEDSFSVRVDKVFGALKTDASPSSGVTSALWCLTDEEIERREWNRDKEGDVLDGGVESGPSVVRNRVEMDLRELSDCEEEEDENEGEDDGVIDGEKKRRRRDSGVNAAEISADEYLEVQSNIGRDCTLDHEEEEDEYDKVAVGTEHQGDRIYVKDVKGSDYGIDDPSAYGELPVSFHEVIRDPRANHMAAKVRLKEDAEAAGNFDTLQLSDNPAVTNAESSEPKKEDDANIPKPILKRSENLSDSRAQKRVRFLVDPKSSTAQVQEQSTDLPLPQYSPGVPDYIRNPSKYTRYTFDSSDDMDDRLNQRAYADLFQYLRKKDSNADTSMDESSSAAEIPKSVTFIPKRKVQDESMGKISNEMENKNKSWSVGVTAVADAQESETSAMEEDDENDRLRISTPTTSKPGRQYRTRTNVDKNDDEA